MTSFRNVYVVVAPSGTGKTTLNNKLLGEFPDLIEMSVSCTTRKIRPTEKEGVDYHFINKEKFEHQIAMHEMLEWANVHGNMYGTAIQEINRISLTGKKILLEIDYQGWKQAKKIIRDAVAVFILPPSLEEMWRRLESRGTDSLQVRWKRLQSAKKEFESSHDYEFFIVNESIESAYKDLTNLIIYGKNPPLTKQEALGMTQRFLFEFENASWIKDIEKQVEEADHD
jgi:guanylate kinase